MGRRIGYEDDTSSEYESEYDDDGLCYYVHDVHDEHGLLAYASDYLIFNILLLYLGRV